MAKYIKIEVICKEGEREIVTFTTDGLNEFEVIGMLTYYRDKIEVAYMNKKEKKTLNTKVK